MNVQETLEKLLRDSDETGDWGFPGRDDDAELLAPVFERALRAAWVEGVADGRSISLGYFKVSWNGVTAGIKAMVEES